MLRLRTLFQSARNLHILTEYYWIFIGRLARDGWCFAGCFCRWWTEGAEEGDDLCSSILSPYGSFGLGDGIIVPIHFQRFLVLFSLSVNAAYLVTLPRLLKTGSLVNVWDIVSMPCRHVFRRYTWIRNRSADWCMWRLSRSFVMNFESSCKNKQKKMKFQIITDF